ncbi:tRNA pseudouridine(13) synthase TruD, partial [Enterococcus hirae]
SAASSIDIPGVRILEAVRHHHPLRLGDLAANHFSIRVRGVTAALWRSAEARLEAIRRSGLANRFGRQRFGRDGDNAARATAWLAERRG